MLRLNIEYDLEGEWRHLRGECGLPSQTGGTVVFAVRADDKEVFRSPVVQPGKTESYEIDSYRSEEIRFSVPKMQVTGKPRIGGSGSLRSYLAKNFYFEDSSRELLKAAMTKAKRAAMQANATNPQCDAGPDGPLQWHSTEACVLDRSSLMMHQHNFSWKIFKC